MGGDRRRVLREQVGERPGDTRERHGEAGVAFPVPLRGRDDADDRAGPRVEHGPSDRPAARAQRVPARRADGQRHCAMRELRITFDRLRVRHCGEDTGLTPASRGEPHVRARLDTRPRADR
ncbi:hypothetical protein [Streptomyces sp. SolWspMP-5a-2]|uniref:hypothetical protein n=1 Tax=Streptomyces sp. SolWspMP-5a-2 TaxID=1838281 RepID=UPI001371B015